jgi:hypothetical protein
MKNIIHILIAGICFSLFTYLMWPGKLTAVTKTEDAGVGRVWDSTGTRIKTEFLYYKELFYLVPSLLFSYALFSNFVIRLMTSYWPTSSWQNDNEEGCWFGGTIPGINIIVFTVLLIAILRDQMSKGLVPERRGYPQ